MTSDRRTFLFALYQGLQPKPVPAVQAVPQAHHQLSFEYQGRELTRYHFAPDQERPFWFPITGPSGRPVTRMGHPQDVRGHSHHTSIWISHRQVNDVNFWEDGTGARIVHLFNEKITDGDRRASLVARHVWIAPGGTKLLDDLRTIEVEVLPNQEWLLRLELQLTPAGGAVTLGKTPFGLIGVRVAKTMGVRDGGGRVLNSEGAINEAGCLWKRARWVDYAGWVADNVAEGVALFDHPSNPGYPSYFHVRDDGWMGCSLTYAEPRLLGAGQTLRLRYALYVHREAPGAGKIDAAWNRWTE